MPGVTEGGSVRASITWDPDGNGPLGNHLVVAGTFTVIANVVASNIAMWNPATDQWSALGSGTNGDVLALAVMPDNTLIAGGRFTACGTTTTSRIAAWNGSAWSPLTDTLGAEGVTDGVTQASVAALARLNDGRLAVGGLFSNAGDAARSRLAIWTGTSWASLSVADIAMTGSESVAALAVRPDGHLIIGGFFNNIGPTAASNIGRWDGTSFFAMANGFDAPVFAIGIRPDSTVIAGGGFLNSGATPMSRLARWTGTNWTAMGAGTDGTVLAIHINPLNTNQIFIGGTFSTAGGIACRNIARTNQNGNTYVALGGGIHNDLLIQGSSPSVRTIVQFAPGVLFAGGFFTSVHTSQMRSIAKWNGGVWSAITPGLSASVRAIDVDPSGAVLLGGSFTNTPSGAANRVATWSTAGFGALGQGASDSVHAVKRLHNNDVVIAGSFEQAGGVPAFSVARYSSGAWSALGSGFLVAYEIQNKTIAQLPIGVPNLGVGDLFVGGDIDGYPPATTVFGLTQTAVSRNQSINQNRWRDKQRREIESDIVQPAYGKDFFRLSTNQRRVAIDRVLLSRQQAGVCPYCGNQPKRPALTERLAASGTDCEIDHIQPYSISGDNSLNNKVLCHTDCNRAKKNRTPREWWGDQFDAKSLHAQKMFDHHEWSKGDYFNWKDYQSKWRKVTREARATDAFRNRRTAGDSVRSSVLDPCS